MSITWFDRCSVLTHLYLVIKAATLPTLKTAFSRPQLFLQPINLRDVFLENVWQFMGDGADAAGRETKADLIPRGHGVLLDIGAGECG